MAKFIPKLIEPVLNYVPSSTVEEIVGFANKAMRAKIFFDQRNPNRPKVDREGPTDAYEFEKTTTELPGNKKHRTYDRITPDGYVSEPVRTKSRVGEDNTGILNMLSSEVITFIDIDFDSEKHGGTRRRGKLSIPFIPRELSYEPTSNFVTIASFSRNNPFYQFTGSEDTLNFEIDWLAKEEHREDVIANCRWLEALTKSDGYDDVPHRVMLSWGADNKLFLDEVWLVVAAPYRLTNFQRAYRSTTGEVKSLGLLPSQAYQTITLKRVTKDNRTSKAIIGNLGYGR